MIPVPPELLTFIQEGRKFIIAGHKEPDGDCLGSQLALASVLDRLGKETILCSAGPFKRTEILPWKDHFQEWLSPGDRDGARAIVLDCGALERTGSLEEGLRGLPLAVIDHHEPQGREFPPGAIAYLDVGAPSTTLLVQNLIEGLGAGPDSVEAGRLFFGLCTDTGFFRHLSKNRGAEAFRAAAVLVDAGADPKKTWQAINGGKSLGSRNLMGIVLARARSECGGKLVYTWEEWEETECYGTGGRDSDSLYQLLLAVGGVEAAVVVRQESEARCAIGLRSRDTADVARIAGKFGGGGHKNAAGASVDGKIRDILPKVIASFREIL